MFPQEPTTVFSAEIFFRKGQNNQITSVYRSPIYGQNFWQHVFKCTKYLYLTMSYIHMKPRRYAEKYMTKIAEKNMTKIAGENAFTPSHNHCTDLEIYAGSCDACLWSMIKKKNSWWKRVFLVTSRQILPGLNSKTKQSDTFCHKRKGGLNRWPISGFLRLVCCSETPPVSAQKVVAAWTGVSHLLHAVHTTRDARARP